MPCMYIYTFTYVTNICIYISADTDLVLLAEGLVGVDRLGLGQLLHRGSTHSLHNTAQVLIADSNQGLQVLLHGARWLTKCT